VHRVRLGGLLRLREGLRGAHHPLEVRQARQDHLFDRQQELLARQVELLAQVQQELERHLGR